MPSFVPLANAPSKFAVVDDEDFVSLSKYTWNVHVNRAGLFYAVRSPCIRMHKVIMQATKEDRIDHIDGDGLNNQRSNLRFCTQTYNNGNSRKRKNFVSGKVATSKYKGVYRAVNKSRWKAEIGFNGYSFNLGIFATEIDAAFAYDVASCMLFKEFSRTNFDDDPPKWIISKVYPKINFNQKKRKDLSLIRIRNKKYCKGNKTV